MTTDKTQPAEAMSAEVGFSEVGEKVRVAAGFRGMEPQLGI